MSDRLHDRVAEVASIFALAIGVVIMIVAIAVLTFSRLALGDFGGQDWSIVLLLFAVGFILLGVYLRRRGPAS